jgi:hypothetical protein
MTEQEDLFIKYLAESEPLLVWRYQKRTSEHERGYTEKNIIQAGKKAGFSKNNAIGLATRLLKIPEVQAKLKHYVLLYSKGKRMNGEGGVTFNPKTGLWCWRITVDGKRKPYYGRTREEAYAKMEIAKANIREQNSIPNNKIKDVGTNGGILLADDSSRSTNAAGNIHECSYKLAYDHYLQHKKRVPARFSIKAAGMIPILTEVTELIMRNGGQPTRIAGRAIADKVGFTKVHVEGEFRRITEAGCFVITKQSAGWAPKEYQINFNHFRRGFNREERT